MKRILVFGILSMLLLAGCKKDNDDGDDDGGGNNGNDLSGNYIIRTQHMCLYSYFVGEKRSGNLVDHQITMTLSDSLNSWYLKKQSNGKYIIYSKLGVSFLIWKEGENVTTNIGDVHNMVLVQTASLPAGDAAPEMQFTFTEVTDGTNQYTIKAQSGFMFQGATGINKVNQNCEWIHIPALMAPNQSCKDVTIGSKVYNYCFHDQFTLQEL